MEASAQTGTPASGARWGLYGDWPWRFMCAAVRVTPGWLERPVIAVLAGLLLCVSGRLRRAARSNLTALRPQDSRLARTHRAWRTLYHFGCVCVDGIRTGMGQQVLRWEVQGAEHFTAAAADGAPVILLTAHMGCYDAAASCFAEQMGGRLNAVRMPERSEALRRFREKEIRGMEHDKLRTLYNDTENLLGVELLKALRDGERVALQADRALPGLSVMTAEHNGLHWQLPRGPFVLAMMSRARCLPVLTIRTGHRRYRITMHPHFSAPETRDRHAAVNQTAQQWLDVLTSVLRRTPEQWLVFEPLVTRAP